MSGGPSPFRLIDLGLGCAPIGNLFTRVTDEDAVETVHAALSAGVAFFDTAPHYGAGLSELRLGAALAGTPRSSFTVATKVGRRIVDESGVDVPPGARGHRTVFDLSYDGVLRSLEGSLERLSLDHVDVLYLHDPPSVDDALGAAYPALLDLRDQGVVVKIGVGMNHWEPLARFATEAHPDVVMVAGRLTLLDASALHGLLPTARSKGVDVVAAGVFNSGVLAEPAPGAHYNYRPASHDILRKARTLAAACADHGVELVAAALQYPRLFDGISRVVVGARSRTEVASAVDAWRQPIPNALWTALSDLGVAIEPSAR